jgi:serine/threonine protein phosphatase PrpC
MKGPLKKNKRAKVPIYIEWNQGAREYQEDYFGVYSKGNRTLMVAADGMGGHSRGDLASQWVVEALVDAFKEKNNTEEIFERGINRAMEKIRQSGKDMGCTMVAAVIEKENETYKLSYTWIGDSRLYLIDGGEKPSDNAKKIGEISDRHLWLLTDDDSFVWSFYLNNELTIDQITQHPNKNQLELSLHPAQENAVDIIKKRIRHLSLKENDRLLLCTDGVWESYPSQADIMMHIDTPNPGKTMKKHLEKAMRDEISTDNGTFILGEMKTEIFNQQCFPQKGLSKLKRKTNSFYAALIAIIFFALIFLLLIGKFDSLFEKFKNHKNENKKEKTQPMLPIKGKSIDSKENGQRAAQQPQMTQGKPAAPQTKKEESNTYFSIQVGAYREYANARRAFEKYRKMNYPARIIEPGRNKLFRVIVGEFHDRNEAQKEMETLEKKEKKEFLIKKFNRNGFR